jgi:hypothetical protein
VDVHYAFHKYCYCWEDWLNPSRRLMWDDDTKDGDNAASNVRMAEEEVSVSRVEANCLVIAFKYDTQATAFFANAAEVGGAAATAVKGSTQ